MQDLRGRYDVCHGDADGLSAAVQWRLAVPGPVRLITGLKRQIALVQMVPVAHASEVNVFDLAMSRNEAALTALLAMGVRVRWFDHHAAHHWPEHSRLEVYWQNNPQICTSLLVDQVLAGRFRAWAWVGAYGDHVPQALPDAARLMGLDAAQAAVLSRLGTLINYNAYGDTLADVCVPPAALYASMCRYADPWQWAVATPWLAQIARQYAQDHQRARAVPVHRCGPRVRMVVLPKERWAARVMGSLANELADQAPDMAHVVLKPIATGRCYRVSVRAPLAAAYGADALCVRMGGSGRCAAAGIDALPEAVLPELMAAVECAW
jgi:hypothetical protein